jgi:hypothetical protein
MRLLIVEKSGNEMVGNEMAEAVEARKRVFVRRILAV